jgi:hypothetical protein
MTTLREAVDALPTTVAEVTRFFVEHNIRGVQSEAMLCPLAMYLSAETGQTVVVGLSLAWPKFYKDDPVELPAHLLGFIEQFDGDILPGREALLV